MHVDRKIRANHCLIINAVVAGNAVDKQQNATVVVAWLTEPAYPQIVIICGPTDFETAHADQSFAKVAPPVTSDFFAPDNRDAGGRCGNPLTELGGSGYGGV